MRCIRAIGIASVWIGLGTACGGAKVLVPPRLDLAPYQRVGLVTFTVENAEGTLGEFATTRFTTQIFQAQRGVEVLELGDEERLLRELGTDQLDAAAMRAIGDEHGVPAVFVGNLVVSDVKPRAALFGIPRLEAEVSVALTVRLRSTESGATNWSRASRATGKVAGIAVVGGRPVFSAQDPEDAYGDLVDYLIEEVTRDLWPTYR